MNTKAMFDEAIGMRIEKRTLMAHVLWCLVSQAGRTPLGVGEVSKFVRGTSGMQPSTYQVKAIMIDLHDARAVEMVQGSWRARGYETRYKADYMAVTMLAAYSYALVGNEAIHKASVALCCEIAHLSDAKLKEMIEFNANTDQPLEVRHD